MIIQNTINGILITDIVNNQYIKQLYQGYNKTEAKRKFKQHLKTVK